MHFSLRGSPCQAEACLAERHLDLHSAMVKWFKIKLWLSESDSNRKVTMLSRITCIIPVCFSVKPIGESLRYSFTAPGVPPNLIPAGIFGFPKVGPLVH